MTMAPSPFPPLPSFDFIVVGGGIMGSCTAFHLAKRRCSVLLLEQFDFLHRRGSSHGETRTIRSTYPELYYTLMMKEAISLWEEAQEEAGYLVRTKTPQLDFGPPHNKALQACISSCKEHGIAVQTLTSAQASATFPAFCLPDDWVAIVTEEGGVIHASKAVAMFQALALKHGAKLCDRTRVNQISRRQGRAAADEDNDKEGIEEKQKGDDGYGVIVSTDKGSFFCRRCVIAAGAWTPKLVEQVCGIRLPIQPLHTTLAYWQIQQGSMDAFKASSGFPSFACYNEPYIYGNASIELPGLIKVSLHSGYKCDPDERALVPDMEALKHTVSPWLETQFRGKVLSHSPVLAEACMYSMTPDQDFILDFVPMEHDVDGDEDSHPDTNKLILVAAGFSGHGFKMGPLVGRILADLCLHGTCEGVPLHHFSISRFFDNPRGNVKEFEEQVSPLDKV